MGCLLAILGGGGIFGVAIALALMIMGREAKAKKRAIEVIGKGRIDDRDEVNRLIRILGRPGIDKEPQHLCQKLLELRDKAS
jgi:hypothetical protein